MTTIDPPPPALAAAYPSGEQSYHAHIVACVNAVPPSVPLTYNEWSSRRLLEHDRKLNALQRRLDTLSLLAEVLAWRMDELDGDGRAQTRLGREACRS